MESNVTFKILWSGEDRGHNVKILCGNVEGDGLPVPVYMAILQSMSQVEKKINGITEPTSDVKDSQPTDDNIEALHRMGEAWRKMGEDMLKEELAETSTPPHAENSSK